MDLSTQLQRVMAYIISPFRYLICLSNHKIQLPIHYSCLSKLILPSSSLTLSMAINPLGCSSQIKSWRPPNLSQFFPPLRLLHCLISLMKNQCPSISLQNPIQPGPVLTSWPYLLPFFLSSTQLQPQWTSFWFLNAMLYAEGS